MEKRVQFVVEAFKARYGERPFIKRTETLELIPLLLQGDKVERMIAACQAGQAPLRVVVYEVEAFAEAFSEYIISDNPRPEAAEIGRQIESVYKTGKLAGKERR